LDEIIENYPPELVVDIFRDMTFIKVPFSKPMLVKAKDCNERGSFSYMNPWHENNKTPSSVTEREAPVASRGYFVRTPAVLPLPGLGTVDFLSSLLVKAPPTVFDNDAMAVVLRVLWNVCRSQTFGSLLFLSVFNRSHHLFAGCFQNHIKKYLRLVQKKTTLNFRPSSGECLFLSQFQRLFIDGDSNHIIAILWC